ncbi:MAG: electron transport complex subunit RsxC [Desulfofustis sp. PB-SRB1]|jgi:electron transport complex protein RnfC|nr:electron transport complex subunit RsxC [Desulfofustis sp. PB-SRB1]MBM1003195.1 electron transport complex subunit RsxC [Desulfofustis sp. PB-SRB1]HBH29226.1 electron transport complex subunit RsxC [Desulfofustis sp.]HBH30999.1 electron transport complex subunit RsxC [Desulfofustis sp.]
MAPTFSFPKGGVHPPEAKAYTEHLTVEPLPLPDEIDLILSQHIGAPCVPTVAKKQEIGEGALVGTVEKGLGVPLHSPVSGTVKAVGNCVHPIRVSAPAITIKVDKEAAPIVWQQSSWEHLDAQALLGKIKDGGIIGIGGAGFPTHVKLKPPADAKIDTLILNGAECEPYITADHRTMVEQTDKIVEGARILLTVLGINTCVIAIETNKPDAIGAMSEAVAARPADGMDISVAALSVKYPTGSEKQLIQAITGRKVPAMALPSAVGVVVHNVSTTKAVYDAVVLDKPLLEKVVTVSGGGIERPANLLVKVGTRISDIASFCGGVNERCERVVLGGPMMGFAVSTLAVPITKTTSSILFLREDEIDTRPLSACIRCGWCLDACPMGLEPKEAGIYVEAGRAEDTAQFGVFDCFECGSCAFVCPAKRPLVQFIRLAKMKAKRS